MSLWGDRHTVHEHSRKSTQPTKQSLKAYDTFGHDGTCKVVDLQMLSTSLCAH